GPVGRPAGDARHHDPADARHARLVARLCHRVAHCAGLRGQSAAEHGDALSRIDAARAARLRARFLGRHREQPQGALLCDYTVRPPPARRRERRMEPDGLPDARAADRVTLMSAIREWARRLWGTIRRDLPDAEMEEELKLHLEMAAAELERQGLSPEQAARLARLEAGGIAQTMERRRDQRGLPW